MTFELENVQTNEYPHSDTVWPPHWKILATPMVIGMLRLSFLQLNAGKSVWSCGWIHANFKEVENKRSSCYELLCWLNFQNMGFFMFFVSLLVFSWWRATWKKCAEVHTARAAQLFYVIIFWRARFAGHRCCLNFALLVSLSAFILFNVSHS